jgi:predicted transcriptional regulator
MKSATIPSIRVEPDLREQMEQVLGDGESLSAFVEASVRDSVRRRLEQTEFVRRGLQSLANAAARSERAGADPAAAYVTADSVVARLEARLAAARKTGGR